MFFDDLYFEIFSIVCFDDSLSLRFNSDFVDFEGFVIEICFNENMIWCFRIIRFIIFEYLIIFYFKSFFEMVFVWFFCMVVLVMFCYCLSFVL